MGRLTAKLLLLMTAFIHGIGTTLCAPSSLSSASLQKIHQSQKPHEQNAKAKEKDVLALVSAAANGDIRKVTDLLKKDIEIDSTAPRNSTDFGGQTALMAAAGSGHTDIVRILLSKGAKVNVRHDVGGTAVTAAAAQGHLEVVNELLAAGADPNVIVASMHGQVYTALMFAMRAQNGDWLKIVDAMIAAGAEVNPRIGFYLSPLRLIIDKDDRNMLQALFKKGADINLCDEQGSTPLMYAAHYGSPNMVNALLDAGADINAKNNNGETALMIAQKYSAESVWGEQIVQVLKQRGGVS